ncbi:protein kinase domain-containing protein [Pendulispora albinea]|uniref:Protein kinase n=1 Tax=Pendulispora albinea TaxID=2741071 RepID=A0ABZ2LV35_9BACT
MPEFEPEDIIPGDVKYRTIRHLGSGGMADVYLVEHMLLHGPCALKIIQVVHRTRADYRVRLKREAQAGFQIRSVHLAQVFHIGELRDGREYFIMEYVDGRSLRHVLDTRGPLPPAIAIAIIVDGLEGLYVAHEKGVVHRDVKPENIFVTRQGIAKVLDFGVAKLSYVSNNFTGEDFVGDYLYASPEQNRHAWSVDQRADIFSMGIVLFESLTGRHPFDKTGRSFRKRDVRSIAISILNNDPMLLDHRFPPELARVLNRMLSRDLNTRPSNAYLLAQELREIMKIFYTQARESANSLISESVDGVSVGPITDARVEAPDPALMLRVQRIAARRSQGRGSLPDQPRIPPTVEPRISRRVHPPSAPLHDTVKDGVPWHAKFTRGSPAKRLIAVGLVAAFCIAVIIRAGLPVVPAEVSPPASPRTIAPLSSSTPSNDHRVTTTSEGGAGEAVGHRAPSRAGAPGPIPSTARTDKRSPRREPFVAPSPAPPPPTEVDPNPEPAKASNVNLLTGP